MTTESDAAAVRRLLDIQDIQRVLGLYVIALDSQDLALFDACFTPDAEIVLAGVGTMNPESYKEIAKGAFTRLDATHHHLSPAVIRVDGDVAHARCYFSAQHVRNALAPDPCLLIGGWYTDRLARTPLGWRIARREGTALWYDGNPQVLGYDFPMGAVPRGPGHAAPAWLKA